MTERTTAATVGTRSSRKTTSDSLPCSAHTKRRAHTDREHTREGWWVPRGAVDEEKGDEEEMVVLEEWRDTACVVLLVGQVLSVPARPGKAK